MEQNLPTPGLLRRLASLFYESLLLSSVLLGATALLTPLVVWTNHARWAELLMQLFLALVMFAYFGYCWVRGGQTVAMKPWRVRITLRDGQPLGWQQASMRFVVALVLFVALPAISYLAWQPLMETKGQAMMLSLLWWALPLLWPLMDNDKQFLHDRLAGTRMLLLPPPPPRPK